MRISTSFDHRTPGDPLNNSRQKIDGIPPFLCEAAPGRGIFRQIYIEISIGSAGTSVFTDT